MGPHSSKKSTIGIKLPMEDPFSVYVPLESLNEPTVRSIISVATSSDHPNWDYSERTLLIFLLALNKKLEAIETTVDAVEKKNDGESLQQAQKIRQWLVDRHNAPLKWDLLQKKYHKVAGKRCDELARYHGSQTAEPYFELTVKTPFPGVKKSREYMQKTRSNGYQPEELKLYWNAEQLEALCPKPGESSDALPPHDPSDEDAIINLRQYPVPKRNHSGKIEYINKGIEEAVFDVPKGKQIIVLNFANEQSPGGGYLRYARAQEEVILFNSDGYRALLDLKYHRMSGGYAIPEFGLAYVRNMRFFDPASEDRQCITDMMVSACYCMNGTELYANPQSKAEWQDKNLAKFYAFMSAAVANTKGDGSDTYLLLGPIGTGAFGNDVEEIGEIFRRVLEMKMMTSEKAIRYAFENIWFVSTEEFKNEIFQGIIEGNKSNDNQKD